MKHVHEVLIIPWGGWWGGDTAFDPGLLSARMCEVDIVDGYVRSIADELGDCSIRHRVLPTRSAPGLTEQERLQAIFPNTLVLSCRIGWFRSHPSKMPKSNVSRIFYGGDGCALLAKRFGEAMEHWGQIYGDHGHRSAGAVADPEDPMLNCDGSWGLRFEPFALNGPKADDYCTKLHKLGKDLGRVLTNYLIERDEGRFKPSMLEDTTGNRGQFGSSRVETIPAPLLKIVRAPEV